ncbi:MAG: TIR domain-containing protein [Euryarchaeota archaeon]|nr:TIR domain-containing protein [Euryarchaeota archaeon]MBV1729821.1 TIR domain-containing protein [Methanobacterium sp.]MBV1754490.1 TIR domain-containing protein [Methanobacterium sp.]
MVRKVFFSFHYEEDSWRAAIVRNNWITKEDRQAAGYIDAADWEEIKEEGDEAIKEWIDEQMKGTSVTAVLIGAETSDREWVQYEVKKSHELGKGMLAIHIHDLKNNDQKTCAKGDCNFGPIGEDEEGNPIYFIDKYVEYEWVDEDGYENLGDWVETAAKDAGIGKQMKETPYTGSGKQRRSGGRFA